MWLTLALQVRLMNKRGHLTAASVVGCEPKFSEFKSGVEIKPKLEAEA